MADIRLIAFQPPPQAPVKGPQISQGTSGNNTNPTLPNVESGTTLSGFIINRDSSGNPVLRTDSGDITFASNFFLKIGSEVTIRVDNTANGSLAKILSVDGQPPEIAENTSAFANQPEVVVTSQYRPPSALVSLNASVPTNITPPAEGETAVTVFGTLIKPAAATSIAASTNTASSLPANTQLTLRVLSVETTPSQTIAPQSSEPHPATITNANYAAYARAATSTLQTATSAPSAPEVNLTFEPVQPTAIIPPEVSPNVTPSIPTQGTTTPQSANQAIQTTTQSPQTTSPPLSQAVLQNVTSTSLPTPLTQIPSQTALTAPAPTIQTTPATGIPSPQVSAPTIAPNIPTPTIIGQTVTAQVLGHETTGEALLQTPIGVVRLQPEIALPNGTKLTLQILQTTPPALSSLSFNLSANRPISTQPAPMLELAQGWSSLQQIFSLLTGQSPLTNTNIANVPTTPNQPLSPKDIGPALMVFISALRGGDFKSWLGKDNIKTLESQGQSNLIKKAEAEFNAIANQYAEVKPGHWQALLFPVAVDGVPQQIRIFTKRDRKQGGNQQETKQEDTRFVVEIDLTQLGEIQLDGFVRKQQSDVNFDLVIRSLHPLDKDVQQDILTIYNATGAVAGYKGSLAFQTVKDFPVNPMEDIVASQSRFSV